MSFNFAVTTNAQFGAGKLNELHTMINSPSGLRFIFILEFLNVPAHGL